MLELILIIVFLGSLVGIGVVIIRKIPVLLERSEIIRESQTKNIISVVRKKIKNNSLFNSFFYETFLQKLLSRIKILTLRTETKIDSSLQGLRKKSQKRKKEISDDYWKDLKDLVKKKKIVKRTYKRKVKK